jgi:hypothetical protein
VKVVNYFFVIAQKHKKQQKTAKNKPRMIEKLLKVKKSKISLPFQNIIVIFATQTIKPIYYGNNHI